MVKIICFHCKGHSLIPDQENKIQHVAQQKRKEKKKKIDASVEEDVFESQYFL